MVRLQEVKQAEKLITPNKIQEVKITDCQVSKDKLVVQLNDGREVSMAVSLINKWMFGGENIKPEELKKYEI